MWKIPEYIDPDSVDQTWRPPESDKPYVYHFLSQHTNTDSKRLSVGVSGVTYTVPGATDNSIVYDIRVKAIPVLNRWHIPNYIDSDSIDVTWHPNAFSQPYIYHFPSQHQASSGVTYTVPGATEIKLCSEIVVKALETADNWEIPEDIDCSVIDFSWHPDALDDPYIYHFPSEWQESSGLTYTVPGATEIKLLDETPKKQDQTTANNLKVSKVLDIFFVDKYNKQANGRFDKLKIRYPNAQKIRFANSMNETIKRCIARSSTGRFWVISSENVYDQFDFSWQPQSWQKYMTHVFGSKLQKWSDTFLINKLEFDRNSKWAKSIAEFPNLNFVQDQLVDIPEDRYDVYYVDHNNHNIKNELLSKKFVNFKTTRFVSDYLSTLKRIVATATTEYVWVLSSICDYSDFDFSWEPEPWQKEMIHVFSSRWQKRGDTFLIHVESFKNQMYDLEMLDWFNVINYIEDIVVPRIEMPVHYYEGDDLVNEIRNYEFKTPYAIFTNRDIDVQLSCNACLWSEKDRVITAFTDSNSICAIPRDIKTHLRTQIYDYPYIYTDKSRLFYAARPLDIVYISNGEPNEHLYYDWLMYKTRANFHTGQLHWVKGVNGRTAAYQEAARRSTTPWFFAVFAKLRVDTEFDFNWQPDYFQEPKHYIFHAKNPLNGLEYGHQAMIAYNKRLTLETQETGLDFTLSAAHEVVPILSGVAEFNQNEWMTWRTAFREVLKLKQFNEEMPGVETEFRLKRWLTKAEGNYAEWCLRGAADAVEYYDSVNGDFAKLKLSYEWDWLNKFYQTKYK